MTYPIIAIGLTIVFIGYLLYLVIIKKDKNQAKDYLLPGIVFIVLWIFIYIFMLR